MTDQPRVNAQLESAIKALLFDQPIAYHPVIAKAVGSVTAGVLLSQLLYWTPRSQENDGWIWKTQEQLFEETGLTRKEQESARRYLRDEGILKEKKAGVPAKLYFQVNIERLTGLLATTKDAQNGQTRMPETGNQDRPIRADQPAQNVHAISKTTSEITSEITPDLKISNRSMASTISAATTRLTQKGSERALEESPPQLQQPPPKPASTPQLDAAVEEACEQLDDWQHRKSVLTQARDLLTDSDFTEAAFAQLVRDKLELTLKQGERVERPMAYLFGLIHKALARRDMQRRRPERSYAFTDPMHPTEGEESGPRYESLPPGTDPQQLWNQVREQLAEQVTKPIFATYLSEAVEATASEGRLQVRVPSLVVRHYLSLKLRPLILTTLHAAAGAPVAIAFVAEEESSEESATEPTAQKRLFSGSNGPQGSGGAPESPTGAESHPEGVQRHSQGTRPKPDGRGPRRRRAVSPSDGPVEHAL